MSNIGEMVRGNVSSLFGRFRPPAGKSEEEIRGEKAERLEFTQRLSAQLHALDARPETIVKAARAVFREIHAEPVSNPMPTPDSITERVRQRCNLAMIRPPCPACVKLGGAPGVFLDTPLDEPFKQGAVQLHNDWWCPGHFVIASWYLNRQARFEDGRAFTYPPPWCLVPKDVHTVGALPGQYYEYTDGVLMGEAALYVRDYLESATGNMLLDKPRVTTNLKVVP